MHGAVGRLARLVPVVGLLAAALLVPPALANRASAVPTVAASTPVALSSNAYRVVEVGATLTVPLAVSASAQNVVWSSSAPSVAGVSGDAQGAEVAGLAEGFATIRVDADESSGHMHDEFVISVMKTEPGSEGQAFIRRTTPRLAAADASYASGTNLAKDAKVDVHATSRDYYLVSQSGGDGSRFWLRAADVYYPPSQTQILVEHSSQKPSSNSRRYLPAGDTYDIPSCDATIAGSSLTSQDGWLVRDRYNAD
ncbi:Ig-like domain-containing protein [Nocardioides sp. BYT-33-1]|uniref:Ig-like domain-containing protein n=1 Tax=Nocardioides sp. BYT-33-1 TaxID=3416952 RepID=UPI003F53B629